MAIFYIDMKWLKEHYYDSDLNVNYLFRTLVQYLASFLWICNVIY